MRRPQQVECIASSPQPRECRTRDRPRASRRAAAFPIRFCRDRGLRDCPATNRRRPASWSRLRCLRSSRFFSAFGFGLRASRPAPTAARRASLSAGPCACYAPAAARATGGPQPPRRSRTTRPPHRLRGSRRAAHARARLRFTVAVLLGKRLLPESVTAPPDHTDGLRHRASDGAALGCRCGPPDAVILSMIERPGTARDDDRTTAAYRSGQGGLCPGSRQVGERKEDVGIFSDA